MEKTNRKIFQTNTLTSKIMESACGSGGPTISNYINEVITSYYTPINTQLKKESEFLFSRISNGENIDEEELKNTLIQCVKLLKDYPIADVAPLEQIFIHFTCKRGRMLRYDYIQIVDSSQDEILHHLNDILKTVDEDFNLGMREFGERTPTIFTHWDKLYRYSEIYIALATIIECENIYYPLDFFRTIELIRQLDKCITNSNIKPIKTPYPTNISNSQRYIGIKNEIMVYHTDTGYCTLSGDHSFEKMSPEIKDYYEHFFANATPITNEISESDIENIKALEQEGRMLFSRLKKNKPLNN